MISIKFKLTKQFFSKQCWYEMIAEEPSKQTIFHELQANFRKVQRKNGMDMWIKVFSRKRMY